MGCGVWMIGWTADSTGRSRAVGFVRLVLIALVVAMANPAMARQSVTGVVVDAVGGAPIAGARVQVQTQPATAVFTGDDGRFVLPGLSGNNVTIGAALAYDAERPFNYETTTVSAKPGSDVTIQLVRAPGGNSLSYRPAPSSACDSCHKDQHDEWSASNHARAARNVRVRDLYSGDGTIGNPHSARGYVFIDTHGADNSGLCATCHAPNERPSDPGAVKFNEVSTVAGKEGVTCTSCHQLHIINEDVDQIHLLGNAEFFLPESGNEARHVWGPLSDVGTNSMNAFYAPVFSDSRMCASCHEYVTPGTGAPGQSTYSEWLASPAASDGIHCQDCHMPPAAAAGKVASGSAPTRPGSQRRDHSFPGVYSGRLGDPVELTLVVEEVTPNTVRVRSELTSLVLGHRWPTGVDPRNALLVVEVRLDGEVLELVDGDMLPFWASAEPEVAPGNGDYAGRAGRGYAKVLEGRINGQGELLRPVPFIDAERLFEKTTLGPGETDTGRYTFALPASIPQNAELEVHGRVIYRRAWRDWAVAKGWTEITMDEPWERLVDQKTITQTLEGAASYTVTATAGEGGSITPSSAQVAHGASTSFTVTPDTNYVIDEVSGCGGNLQAGSIFTTGAITGACTVTASFRLKTYTLEYAAGPNGSITGALSQTVDHGSDGSQVEALPDIGYSFARWSDASTANPRTDTNVTADITVTAEFAIRTYTVRFEDHDGTELSSQQVDHGAAAAAPADPSRTGYTFTGWDVDFSSVTSNLTVTAQYEIKTYTVTFVDHDGAELSSQQVDHGAAATAPADPSRTGYTFIGWDIDFSSVTSNLTVTAQYQINSYTVNLTPAPGDGGSVIGSDQYVFGTDVTVRATAAEGFVLVNWTEGGQQVSAEASYTFSMPAANRVLVANFSAGAYIVTLTTNPTGGGTVAGAGGYDFNESVVVSATANEGYTFMNWTEGDTAVSDVAEYPFTMPANDRSLVANFSLNSYTVTAQVGDGAGSITPASQEVDHGQAGIFTVTPQTGWSVTTVSGDTCTPTLDSGDQWIAANIAQACVVTANFSRNEYAVSVTASPEAGGRVSGVGSYDFGSEVTVTAEASDGYRFINWTEGGTQVSTEASYTFTMSANDRDLVANFELIQYRLSVTNGSGSGDYTLGSVVSITAASSPAGQVFDTWTGDIEFVADPGLPSTTLTMPAQPVSLSATYKAAPIETFALSVTSGSGSGEYAAGRAVSIAAALAPEGQVFDRWTGDTAHVETPRSPNTTVVMPAANVAVTATYKVPPVESFELTVSAGSGSGRFPAGQSVTIAANPAPAGQVFDRWLGQTEFLSNPNAPNTEVIMPFEAVSVTAGYRDRPAETFALSVSSGTGGGDYQAGEVISIAADPADEGQVFVRWSGQTAQVANVNLPNTTLAMPAADVSITALYEEASEPERRHLSVVDGTGDGEYLSGRVVLIAADVREGEMFDRWTGQTANIANVNLPNTTLVMPDADVTVTATFRPDPGLQFRLRQQARLPESETSRTESGKRDSLADLATAEPRASRNQENITDERDVPAGLIVRLIAPVAPEGFVFDKWVGQTTHVDNIHQALTFLYMPTTEVDIIATYSEVGAEQSLTVEAGSGDGEYLPGTEVTITAGAPDEGFVFERWEGQTAQLVNVNRPSTTLRMPQTPVRVRAVYRALPVEDFLLTVRGNDSTQRLSAGETVTITGVQPGPNETFARWTGQIGTVEDIFAQETTLYMPATDVTVQASFSKDESTDEIFTDRFQSED